jgi:hypothetical protein
MIDSYTQKKWHDIDTVKDLLDFIEDPKCDVMGMSESLVDISKSKFWTAANVNFSFNLDESLARDPSIRHDELSTTTMVPSELEKHKNHNYGNGYDRIAPDDNVWKIVKALGFGDNSSVWINNQPPGTVMGRHVDFIGCFTYENVETDRSLLEMKYDKSLRQPKELKTIWRCFVALDDWKPGQIVNFEPNFWTNWKKGDTVFFDWRNTPHTTCNGGFDQRPFLKITGVIDNDDYVTKARETGTIKQVSA